MCAYLRLATLLALAAQEDHAHLEDEHDVLKVRGLLHFAQVVRHVAPLHGAVHLQVPY